MKKFLLFATIAAAFSSCSNDTDGALVIGGQEKTNIGTQVISDLSVLKSRVATMNVDNAFPSWGSRAASVAQPEIPGDALELVAGEWGGLDFYQGNEYWNNGGTLIKGQKNYYVPAGKEVKVDYVGSESEDEFVIYVAGKLDIKDFRNCPKVTFNVLKGGELTYVSTKTGNDNLMKVYDTINVWGKFTPGVKNPWAYPEPEMFHGLSIIEGGSLNYYAGCDPIEIGDGKLPAYFASLNIAQGGSLYAEEQVKVNGTAWFQDGKGEFRKGFDIDGNLSTKENGGVYDIYECSYIRGQWVGESNSGGTYNIYTYLYCGSLHDNSANVVCNLYEALVSVDNVFEETIYGYPLELQQDYKINRLVDKNGSNYGFSFIGMPGNYASVVRYLNNDLYFDDGNNCTVESGTGVHKTMNIDDSFKGNINLITNMVKCQYTHIAGQDVVYKKGEQEGILNFTDATATINNPDCYLPGVGECRPQIGEEPTEPSPAIVAPSHKYSATGIAFDDATGLVYISWHSNIGNDRDQKPWHGTNWAYGNGTYSPNVEGANDWGGIVDVIDIASYNPNTLDGLFKQSFIQNEHKYNHIVAHDGLLYMPSESNKVQAAMHVISLNADGTIPVEDGKLPDDYNARINLTGSSANCVEVIDDKLATISGYSKGAVNYFSIGDYSNQTQKPVFGASAADFTKVNGEAVMKDNNFGGKYIVNVNGRIVTLNNTDNGTISVFDNVAEGQWTPSVQFNTGKIVPKDGKNGIAVDGNLVYVCHSNEGLTINDITTGERVGGTFRGANAVDFDENYIYVAAGNGLLILSKTETYMHPEHNMVCNKIIKTVGFTGAGFIMPDGKQYISDSETVKQSANFVKVHTINGKKYIFVAYGAFGLRYYTLDFLGL